MGFISEEFSKMKEEVPPLLVEAQVKNIEAHKSAGGDVDPGVGLAKSGITAEPSKVH